MCFERKNKLTAKQQDSLTKIRSISVFRVETIRTTYILHKHAAENKGDIAIEEDSEAEVEVGDELRLLISNACQNVDLAAAEALGKYLDIDILKLSSIISSSNEFAEQVLDRLGASELVVEEYRDTSWLDESPSLQSSSPSKHPSAGKPRHSAPAAARPTIASQYGTKTSDCTAEMSAIEARMSRVTISGDVQRNRPAEFIPQSASALAVAVSTIQGSFDSSDIAQGAAPLDITNSISNATGSITRRRAVAEDQVNTGMLGEFYVRVLH
jgi:hypothetical protein